MMGPLPAAMLNRGLNTDKFYHEWIQTRTQNGSQRQTKMRRLKTREDYAKDMKIEYKEPKRYFRYKFLGDIIMNYTYSRKALKDRKEMNKEQQRRASFTHFLTGILQLNPNERWTAAMALQHPFIAGVPLPDDFEPVREPRRQFKLTGEGKSAGTASTFAQPKEKRSNNFSRNPTHASDRFQSKTQSASTAVPTLRHLQVPYNANFEGHMSSQNNGDQSSQYQHASDNIKLDAGSAYIKTHLKQGGLPAAEWQGVPHPKSQLHGYEYTNIGMQPNNHLPIGTCSTLPPRRAQLALGEMSYLYHQAPRRQHGMHGHYHHAHNPLPHYLPSQNPNAYRHTHIQGAYMSSQYNNGYAQNQSTENFTMNENAGTRGVYGQQSSNVDGRATGAKLPLHVLSILQLSPQLQPQPYPNTQSHHPYFYQQQESRAQSPKMPPLIMPESMFKDNSVPEKRRYHHNKSASLPFDATASPDIFQQRKQVIPATAENKGQQQELVNGGGVNTGMKWNETESDSRADSGKATNEKVFTGPHHRLSAPAVTPYYTSQETHINNGYDQHGVRRVNNTLSSQHVHNHTEETSYDKYDGFPLQSRDATSTLPMNMGKSRMHMYAHVQSNPTGSSLQNRGLSFQHSPPQLHNHMFGHRMGPPQSRLSTSWGTSNEHHYIHQAAINTHPLHVYPQYYGHGYHQQKHFQAYDDSSETSPIGTAQKMHQYAENDAAGNSSDFDEGNNVDEDAMLFKFD